MNDIFGENDPSISSTFTTETFLIPKAVSNWFGVLKASTTFFWSILLIPVSVDCKFLKFLRPIFGVFELHNTEGTPQI